MIDRKEFYSEIRQTLTKGGLVQQQVDGIESILDEWDSRDLHDYRWLAYMLATAWHETAHTMQPIEEFGKGKDKAYPPYYGRGLVQLTWKRNYKTMSNILGVDLVSNPEKALEPANSVKILFEFMIRGIAGKSLADYFNADTDWVGARAIVNGRDRQAEIAEIAKRFYAAIQKASGGDKIIHIEPEPDTYVTDSNGDTLPVYYQDKTTSTVSMDDVARNPVIKLIGALLGVIGMYARRAVK